MPEQIIELCKKVAEITLNDKFRQGNIIKLPEKGKVVVSGDLHGHRRNFEKLLEFADLENNPQTYLILQEIIHGGPTDQHGGCLSFNLLFDVMNYKIRFPQQIFVLMGNHDTAVITDCDVSKGGREMTGAMKAAMQRQFKGKHEELENAMKTYLKSQPLAASSNNGIWISHSLPAGRFIENFDMSIFGRKLNEDDLRRPGSAYYLTWGRRHRQETLDKLAQMLDAEIFILGHQSQENGYCKGGDNLIILACDHNHGCFLDFELDKKYTTDQLMDKIKPLAQVG
jgi:Icc-related predicted phosphoesterase